MRPDCNEFRNGTYFVEKVIAQYIIKEEGIATPQFKVKWLGYPIEQSTWETSANIHDDLINEFIAEARINGIEDGFGMWMLPEAQKLFKRI